MADESVITSLDRLAAELEAVRQDVIAGRPQRFAERAEQLEQRLAAATPQLRQALQSSPEQAADLRRRLVALESILAFQAATADALRQISLAGQQAYGPGGTLENPPASWIGEG